MLLYTVLVSTQISQQTRKAYLINVWYLVLAQLTYY